MGVSPLALHRRTAVGSLNSYSPRYNVSYYVVSHAHRRRSDLGSRHYSTFTVRTARSEWANTSTMHARSWRAAHAWTRPRWLPRLAAGVRPSASVQRRQLNKRRQPVEHHHHSPTDGVLEGRENVRLRQRLRRVNLSVARWLHGLPHAHTIGSSRPGHTH